MNDLQSSRRSVSIGITYINKSHCKTREEEKGKTTRTSGSINKLQSQKYQCVNFWNHESKKNTHCHAAMFTYQSCVFDRNDEIKERFQSCFVPRRIFLNLKRGKKYTPASESPAPFNSRQLYNIITTQRSKFCRLVTRVFSNQACRLQRSYITLSTWYPSDPPPGISADWPAPILKLLLI